jgi:hypothetical protein
MRHIHMTMRLLIPGLLSLWALGGLPPGLGVARAQNPPNATLYEVTENLKLKPLTNGRRQATAALMGSVVSGTSICPAELLGLAPGDSCAITAIATDNINLGTGIGPVHGSFAVVIQFDNPVDGPELVILRGHIEGTIDLSPTVVNTPPVPLGTLRGHWNATGVAGGPLAGVHQQGSLTGTFRLPFVLGDPAGCLSNPATCTFMSPPSYLADDGTLVEVKPQEFSLGTPTVKLELTFTPGP